jgi:hypothetical protein
MSLKQSLSTLSQRDLTSPFPLPFSFPSKLSVMCIASMDESGLQLGLPLYNRLVELAGSDSSVLVPEGPLSVKSVQAMFQKLSEANFASFEGMLKCGNLGCQIILSPSPQVLHMPWWKCMHTHTHICTVGTGCLSLAGSLKL